MVCMDIKKEKVAWILNKKVTMLLEIRDKIWSGPKKTSIKIQWKTKTEMFYQRRDKFWEWELFSEQSHLVYKYYSVWIWPSPYTLSTWNVRKDHNWVGLWWSRCHRQFIKNISFKKCLCYFLKPTTIQYFEFRIM